MFTHSLCALSTEPRPLPRFVARAHYFIAHAHYHNPAPPHKATLQDPPLFYSVMTKVFIRPRSARLVNKDESAPHKSTHSIKVMNTNTHTVHKSLSREVCLAGSRLTFGVEKATLPAIISLDLETDEAELDPAATHHVLALCNMLNQHATLGAGAAARRLHPNNVLLFGLS